MTKGHYTLNLVPGSYEITIEAIDFKKTVITKNISGASSLENFTLENETTVTNTKTKRYRRCNAYCSYKTI
jgi:hypothetical protein